MKKRKNHEYKAIKYKKTNLNLLIEMLKKS